VASLDPARWQRARELFDAVADLDAAERQARLTTLCAGDEALRHEVESLLAHDERADDPIGRVVGAAALGVTADAVTGPGQSLLHYRITGPIGEGGMGIVWRARDETLGRDVAIKVLPPGLGDDPRRLARFEREAQLLASLNHSNIAAIFSLHLQGGVRFLAMEYVPGEDLSVRLLRGPVPLDETLRIGRQIAEALEEAHEQGVVHRDLKPANVKLTPSGRVKVLDFGLAKAFTDSPEADAGTSTSSDSALAQLTTREGVVLGTAAYMPPEQARGAVVDKRADIWAFGAVLYEMLTGTRPFAGASVVDLLAAVVTAEPDWTRLPAGTPPALERLLRRCLHKDARQRLRDIGDARIEIDGLITGSSDGSGSRPAMPWPATPAAAHLPARARRRWRDALLVAASALMAVGITWVARRPVEPPVAAVQRLNIGVATGTRLEDVIGSGRQSLVVSRDGTTVVFVGRQPDGRRQIYRRRLDQVFTQPVEGTSGGDMPFLSPDGQWLGFAADGKLKKVAIGGGQPLVICDAPEPRGATWGDDDTIVFAANPRAPLSRVKAAGGTPTALTTVDASVGGHRWPLVLPGSRIVIFNAESATASESGRTIEALDLVAGTRRTLVQEGTFARVVADVLLYLKSGTLFAAPFDPSRLAITGPAVPVLDDVRMDPTATGRAFLDISPTGALVYVPGFPRPGARRLTWIDRQGVTTPVAPETRAFRGARLSPDGWRIAATTFETTFTLWVFDLQRTTWNRVATEGEITTPAWTPDGRMVLFASSKPDGLGIYQVRPDGSAPPEPLYTPHAGVVDMPAVTADGRTVYVAMQNPASDDIYAVSMTAPHNATPVLTGPGGEVAPATSPSGRYLAYSSNETGRREIYIRALDGSGARWTVSITGGTSPKWRADEREMFYLEGTRMMAVPVDTTRGLTIGTPRALFDHQGFAWSDVDLTRYDVTTDGQRFLIVEPEPRELAPLQIVVAPQFGAEMRTRLGR